MNYFQINQAIEFWASIIGIGIVLLIIFGCIVGVIITDIKEKIKEKNDETEYWKTN